MPKYSSLKNYNIVFFQRIFQYLFLKFYNTNHERGYCSCLNRIGEFLIYYLVTEFLNNFLTMSNVFCFIFKCLNQKVKYPFQITLQINNELYKGKIVRTAVLKLDRKIFIYYTLTEFLNCFLTISNVFSFILECSSWRVTYLFQITKQINNESKQVIVKYI